MTVIKNEVRDAIAKDLAAAEQAHGLHHSAAEKYAVMLEELEEAEEELQACRAHLARLWHGVRLDRSDMVDGHAARLAYAAELAACECIQLAAMARKAVGPIVPLRRSEGEPMPAKYMAIFANIDETGKQEGQP